MSVLTLEAVVEKGRIRLLDGEELPDQTLVYVVVPGTARPSPRLASPRLADARQADRFTLEVTEPAAGSEDAELRRR